MKKIKNRINSLIMIYLCIIFISCITTKNKVIYDGLKEEITVKQLVIKSSTNAISDRIYFTYEQDTRIISCSINKKIEAVSSDPSWCTVNVNKVDNNSIILIQIEKNNGQERTTNIKISVEKAEPVRIEVIQYSSTPIYFEGIPIMVCWGVNVPAFPTVEQYLELKECGIDHKFYDHFKNVEQLAQAMDAAKRAGIRMVIYCPELLTEPEKIVKRFKSHPALAGYFICDEPTSDRFQNIGELVRKIQEIDSSHFCYVNLLPMGSDNTTLLKYRPWVQSFLNKVPVQLLSFDCYPISLNSSGERFLSSGWYENLEIISDEARNAGIPFWAYALTTSHFSFPIPTLADLRLQIYSNLAYGAQGIQYFTYWTPSPIYNGNWHEGPIDYSTQHKTATWYTVQKVSREIKALSNVFLGACVIKVGHIVTTATGGNGSVPDGTTRFNFLNRPAEASIIKTFIIPNNTKAVVSFLKNGNRCYMVIINRNFEGGDNVTFTITGGAGLQLIKKDGTAVPASSENSNQTITPGDVLIYGWDI